MGLFGESRKEREAREERALAAMLNVFEEEVKNSKKTVGIPDAGKNTDLKKSPANAPEEKTAASPQSAGRTATVEDLAVFLARKGLLSLSEWEEHKTKHGPHSS